MGKLRRTPKRVIVHRMNPDGCGVCDGCGIVVPYYDLREQFDYRGGNAPVGLGYRVCSMCYDVPNEQLRLQKYPPDPVPFKFPRPDPAIEFYLLTQDGLVLATEDGKYIGLDGG